MSKAKGNALSHVINCLESGSWQFLPLPAKIVIPKSIPLDVPNLPHPATFLYLV